MTRHAPRSGVTARYGAGNLQSVNDLIPTGRVLLRSAALALLVFASSAPIRGAESPWKLDDDFLRYAEGSGGEPRWEPDSIGFMIRDGAMRFDAGASRGVSILREAPLATALAIEATLTVHRSRGKEWKTAGVGIRLDDRNFWHLAFVEAPGAMGGRHFCELSEKLDDVWNAQSEAGSRLTRGEATTGEFAWNFGTPYRLRLVLDRGGAAPVLTGEIREGDALRFRRTYRFDAKAVDRGRPMLNAAGLVADFDDFRTTIHETASEQSDPSKVKPEFPSFVSAPLTIPGTLPATGFFRVADQDGTWWLVDPRGKRTLSVGTDHVGYRGHWCERLGYSPYQRNVEKKFGDAANWAESASARLRSWNFNSLGAGHSAETRYRGLAHTEFIAFGSEFSDVASLVEKTFWTGFPDVFDPRWERFCELRARQRCGPHRDDPWLLGYFLDNELEWWGKTHQPTGIPVEVAKLPGEAAGKRVLAASLREFYRDDFMAFSAGFPSEARSFDDVVDWKELPPPGDDRARAALMAFVERVARRYYETTTAAIRRHDPNHLILGNRFAGDAPEAAWDWAGRTCDIVTVNIYPRADLQAGRLIGAEDFLRRRFEQVRKPIIITEWSFPALDAKDSRGRPLPSQHGAGMRVDTQAQKARCYAIMQRSLAALPFVVGSHYFMWSDEPADGISSSFPEDSNYGLVSEADEPYAELTATAARINALLPELHSGELDVSAAALPEAPGSDVLSSLNPVPGVVDYAPGAGGFTIETGALKAVRTPGSGAAFDHVFVRETAGGDWIELGSFRAVMHIIAEGTPSWNAAAAVIETEAREQTPERLVLEMTFARDARPAWQSRWRFTFEAGQPFFHAQALWVENTGGAPWKLGGCFHYALPNIRGNAGDDEPGGAAVPNYYRPIGAWRDASGLQFGVNAPVGDARFAVTFWKDSGFHADARRLIDLDLAPGERWTAPSDEPQMVIFGGRL